MRRMTTQRLLIVGLLVALVLAACSGGESESTTTTTVAEPATTIAADEPEDDRAEGLGIDEEGMCRTLELLLAGGATGPAAAGAMRFVDLAEATPGETFAYGQLLLGAPQTTCPELREYALEVAYWLGI